MRTIRYGFFGEDEAQRIFLRYYLAALTKTQEITFVADETFRLMGENKSRVDNLFADACEIGLLQHQQQCFFVGRDLDDHSAEAFRNKVVDMQAKLSSRSITAILLIPVQCIEHWLLYLQWHTANPKATKNVNFETMPRKEAKIKIYGKPKPSLNLALPIVETIAAGLDIDWLASRSGSFLSFHRQVTDYLTSLPRTTE